MTKYISIHCGSKHLNRVLDVLKALGISERPLYFLSQFQRFPRSPSLENSENTWVLLIGCPAGVYVDIAPAPWPDSTDVVYLDTIHSDMIRT